MTPVQIITQSTEAEIGPVESGEAGFTLLEVIVAIAIFAMSMALIFQVISASVGRVGDSEQVSSARVLAQSLIARVGRDIPTRLGQVSGEQDGSLRWSLRQAPFRDGASSEDQRLIALEVTSKVSWGRAPFARSLEISTLRLVEKGRTP